MSGAPRVVVSDEGAVRILRISNPAKKNALTRGLLGELVEALPAQVSGVEQPIRAVVVTGDPEGGAFSSGYDINAIDAAEREQGLDPIRVPADAIEACPVPVIAALNGHVFGGAFELAMACHIRVVAADAKLGMPPAKLGLVYSASGLQRFLNVVSPSTCHRLFLTGTPITGEEAVRLGLADVHCENDVDDHPVAIALTMARAIANNAPLAVGGLLDAIRRLSAASAREEDLEVIEQSRAATVNSRDLQEGVLAFVERRAPVFRGE